MLESSVRVRTCTCLPVRYPRSAAIVSGIVNDHNGRTRSFPRMQVNNNAACAFDGGDCCASTCVDDVYHCFLVSLPACLPAWLPS